MGLISDRLGPDATVEDRINQWQKMGKQMYEAELRADNIIKRHCGKPSLGQLLKTMRIRNGLSQETLAPELGVSRIQIGKYERGDAVPGAGPLVAYLFAFPELSWIIQTIWDHEEWTYDMIPQLGARYRSGDDN